MDYQSNSKKSKEEKSDKPEKKIEKVIETDAVTRKKPIGRRIRGVLFGGEFQSATRYIAAEVLLPAVRNLLFDATTEGMRRMVYGESNTQRPRRNEQYRPRTTYNNPVRRADPREFRPPDQPPRPIPSRHSSNEIVLSSREEAELVLERLTDVLDQYEVASVADLHDLVGLPSAHVDNKWGWTYLTRTEIRQVREGYILELPATEPI